MTASFIRSEQLKKSLTNKLHWLRIQETHVDCTMDVSAQSETFRNPTYEKKGIINWTDRFSTYGGEWINYSCPKIN